MIIKRSILFITMAMLLLLPWQVFGGPSKNLKNKDQAAASKKVAQKKSSSSKIQSNKKSNKSLRASTQKKHSKQSARKKQSQKVAREQPVQPKNAPPLIKITPLDNGKFLLEPLDSSSNRGDGSESLSLIKKPVFEEGLEVGESREEKNNYFLGFPGLLVEISKQLMGTSYLLGGNGQGNQGIDCSGFMKKIYQSLTLSLPHSSREQAKLGSLVTTELDLSSLRIGDLLFFKRKKGQEIGHTGMYIGEGKMIHSSRRKGGVIISELKGSYYNRNFVMAKRLFILEDPLVNDFKEFKETITSF